MIQIRYLCEFHLLAEVCNISLIETLESFIIHTPAIYCKLWQPKTRSIGIIISISTASEWERGILSLKVGMTWYPSYPTDSTRTVCTFVCLCSACVFG